MTAMSGALPMRGRALGTEAMRIPCSCVIVVCTLVTLPPRRGPVSSVLVYRSDGAVPPEFRPLLEEYFRDPSRAAHEAVPPTK